MRKGSPGRIVTVESGATSAAPAPSALAPLLSVIEPIARIAADADSVAIGLSSALDCLCGAIGWPIGHVYRRDADTAQSLVSADLWHLDQADRFAAFQEATQHTTFRPGQGLIGLVLSQQRPALSPDVAQDRRFLRRRAARADGVHAWLGFPVWADGQVLAVCELFTTERVQLDRSLAGLLTCLGLTLGRLYERERWRSERAALRWQIATGGEGGAGQDRAAVSALAAAIAHEVNSPLFSARTSLALLSGAPGEQPLVASARADLAQIAAIMATLQSLAQAAPLGQRIAAFIEPPDP